MKSLTSFLKNNIRDYAMLIALVVIMILFQIMTKGILFKPVNITNLVLQNSYIIAMALGMLLIIISGWIDLSVGSIVAVIGAVASVLIVKMDVNWMLTVGICLLLGAVIGAWQGYWVAYVKIPAFIVTLAGMLIFRGLTFVILQGESIGPFPTGFQKISTGFITDFFNVPGIHLTTIIIGAILSLALVFLDYRTRLNERKYGFEVLPIFIFVLKNVIVSAAIMGLCYILASYRGLPNVLVLLFVLITFYSFVSSQTVIGRRIYA
ncbi:MAG: sugar ABC transporter permease, partial [Anaerolineae bacterium]|nr:sugar ABC transporter permease [Anaerolineae bacterium]